jgi:hypothetical protein
MSFDLYGVSTLKNGVSQVDMSWKSFAVASKINLNGFEVNEIGSAYLEGVASLLASQLSGSTVRISFSADGVPVFASAFPQFVAQFDALNFSRLSVPISSWKSTFDPSANTIAWSFNTRFGRDIAQTRTVTELGLTTTSFYGLFFELGATITSPGRSLASGDSLSVVFTDFPEAVMAAAVLSTCVVGSGAFVLERRLLGRSSKGKARR